MRILHVNTINQVANLYADGLNARNHVSTIYQPSMAGGMAPLPIKLAMMPGRVADLLHIAGKLNPTSFDIIHIHWATYGLVGLASRVPFVVQCHGSDVRYRLKNPVFRAALGPVFQRAAAVLCATPDLLPVVRTLRADAIYLPAPVDTEHFSPPIHRQPARPWTVLLFSRLEAIKGSEVAVAGIGRFASRHPEVRIQLLDWGRLSAEYKRRYGHRFSFISTVAPDRVQELLWEADVVVGQFEVGALGLSELQAMSCAIPVIANYMENEEVPSSPPLFRATNPDEVDASLEHLYQHPEDGVAMGRNACNWIRRHYAVDVLAMKLESIYMRCLTGELPSRSATKRPIRNVSR